MNFRLRYVVYGLVALGLAAYGAQAWATLRPFPNVEPRGGEGCFAVPIDPGPEDMDVDPSTGTVWIATAERRGDPFFAPSRGALFAYRGREREHDARHAGHHSTVLRRKKLEYHRHGAIWRHS